MRANPSSSMTKRSPQYQNQPTIRKRVTRVGATYNEMVATRFLQHVRHQFCRDRCATLVLLVLSRIREQWDDSGDSLRAGDLASVDHDAQLHQGRVHSSAPRIDDVHVVLADGLYDTNVRLANAVLRQLCARDRYAEPGHSQSPPEWDTYRAFFVTVCR